MSEPVGVLYLRAVVALHTIYMHATITTNNSKSSKNEVGVAVMIQWYTKDT